MNRDQIEGKWKQLRGEVKRHWGDLTEDDLDRVQGDYDKLVGILQESYGKTRDEAERELNDWLSERV